MAFSQLPKLVGFSIDAEGVIPEARAFLGGVADGETNRAALIRSRTTAAIDTFINDVSTTRTNISAAGGRPRSLISGAEDPALLRREFLFAQHAPAT